MRRPAGFAACAFSILAPIVLTGCAAAGANYVRPQLPSPPQYRFAEGPAEAESLADLPWWQVFGDPTLQALIREAIANNLDLRAALARVERARAQAGIAKSFLYPQVDGTVTSTVRQNTGDGGVQQNGV